MLGRLLCLIGWHRWSWNMTQVVSMPMGGHREVHVKVCERCGAERPRAGLR